MRIPVFILAAALVAAGCGQGQSSRPAADIEIEDQVVQEWTLATNGKSKVRGKLTLEGKPVSGAIIKFGNLVLNEPTSSDGSFTLSTEVDHPLRKKISVHDASDAKVGQKKITADDRRSLMKEKDYFSVSYEFAELDVQEEGGKTIITGKVRGQKDFIPPVPVVYAFRLHGTVEDEDGPVEGVRISTRTQDREVWTLSPKTDEKGKYDSWFWPSSEAADSGYDIRLSVGAKTFEPPVNGQTTFEPLKSAQMNINIADENIRTIQIQAEPGRIYEAFLVGVSKNGKVVVPDRASLTDKNGYFEIEVSGKAQDIELWQMQDYFYSEKDLLIAEDAPKNIWPKKLAADVPRISAR